MQILIANYQHCLCIQARLTECCDDRARGLFRLRFLKIAPYPYLSSIGQTLFASFIYLNLAFYQSQYQLPEPSLKSLVSVILLAVLGSSLAFSSFNWLLKNSKPSIVATYAYVNPIVSLFAAYFFLNETITLIQFLYTIMILLSVYLTIRMRDNI
jgi:drug/metabolite transporter (DMT)-like permease